jgi:hypothetical protein
MLSRSIASPRWYTDDMLATATAPATIAAAATAPTAVKIFAATGRLANHRVNGLPEPPRDLGVDLRRPAAVGRARSRSSFPVD